MVPSTVDMLVHYRETTGDVPPRLIGASTTLAGSKLYLFGGALASAPEIRLLSALYAFDIDLSKWERIKPAVEDSVPKARYLHTTELWNNHLVVFGGLGAQGNNADLEQLQVLNDVRLFDLSSRRWLPQPAGITVRSSLTLVPRPRHTHLACVSSNRMFIIGGKDLFGVGLDDVCVYDLGKKQWTQRQQYAPIPDLKHGLAVSSRWHTRTPPLNQSPTAQADFLLHPSPLPFSERATRKSPRDIYVYNAEHAERRLEILSSLPNADEQVKKLSVDGKSHPPYLRFPSGGFLGTALILAGNYATENKDHLFFIWRLDLGTNTWSPLDFGERLKTGSWTKGVLCDNQNKFIVFGNRIGPFADSPDRVVLAWNQVAVVDLEAVGIFQPPPLKMDDANQRLGLVALAEGRRADFTFLCEDGRQIQCSRKLIVERWPWFQEQQARLKGDPSASVTYGKCSEITIAPTSCAFAQSYPVTMALVQYFYTMSLGTALQRAPAVLSYLLVIATDFNIPHLKALVRHGMHVALSEATAAGVYEIAALCGCRSLQIRWDLLLSSVQNSDGLLA
ncbi:galactose oxidase [Mycena belliarum]|uniref:Galactose oxidase n=1 Tax=Mycena belliarum TaxID=1033014 RepID=A0AAD6TVD7_9AGAR|nr:galactose oxidase [Mycena belliae]